MSTPATPGSAPMPAAQAAAKIIVIMGGSAMMTLLPMAVVVALPTISAELGGTVDGELLAQFILAIPSLLVAVGAPVAAVAAQRFGMRNAMVITMAIYALSGLLSMVAPNLAVLIASRMLLGLSGGAAAALAVSVVPDFPENKRHLMIGLNGAGGTAAAIIGLLLSGWLLDSFGWRATFSIYLLSIPVLIAALVGVSNKRSVEGAHGGGIAEPLRLMWVVYAMVFLMTVGYFTPTVETAFVLADQGTSGGAELGKIIMFYAASSTVFAFAYPLFRRVLGSRGMTVLCLLSLAASSLIMGLTKGVPLIALALIAGGAGAGLTAPTINSIILDRAPERIRAAGFGLMVSSMFVAQALTPFVLGGLRGMVGMYGALTIVGTGLLALAVAAYVTGFGRTRAPEAAPAE